MSNFKTGNKKPHGISVDEKLWTWAKKYSEVRGMTPSGLVNQLLQEHKDKNHGIYLPDGSLDRHL